MKVGDTIIMPEPDLASDSWNFGGFLATIIDILDDGTAIVEDQDSDCYTVEINRLEKVE